jgi:hypothetical protein
VVWFEDVRKQEANTHLTDTNGTFSTEEPGIVAGIDRKIL